MLIWDDSLQSKEHSLYRYGHQKLDDWFQRDSYEYRFSYHRSQAKDHKLAHCYDIGSGADFTHTADS